MIKYCKQYFDDYEKTFDVIKNIDKLRNKSILITGCTGMICSAVVDLLFTLNCRRKYGIQIFLASRNAEKVKKRFCEFEFGKDYTFLKYDATRMETLNISVDYIIHGASNANPKLYLVEPVETMLSNIIGLNVLLQSAKEKKGSRLLYLSSSEVYGKKENNTPYLETEYGYVDILNSRSCYPSSKRAAESLCVAYGMEFGVDVVIARPGHIYGPTITPHDDRASAQFTRSAKAGSNIVMKSDGAQLRSYCYTVDCASALIAILLNGINYNAYNISNSSSIVTIRELAKALATVSGIDLVVESASDIEKKGYNMMSNSSLNSKKIESLGWHAIFSLLEGVKRTLDYYYE